MLKLVASVLLSLAAIKLVHMGMVDIAAGCGVAAVILVMLSADYLNHPGDSHGS